MPKSGVKLQGTLKVHLDPKLERQVREFAREREMSISGALRFLIKKQLHYLAWKARGKPKAQQEESLEVAGQEQHAAKHDYAAIIRGEKE